MPWGSEVASEGPRGWQGRVQVALPLVETLDLRQTPELRQKSNGGRRAHPKLSRGPHQDAVPLRTCPAIWSSGGC